MKDSIREEALFKHGKIIELEKGEVLHTGHDICRTLGRVEKGKMRISRMLSSGKEIILKEFYPGEIFAELIVFTREKYPGWIIASEASTVVEVGLTKLLEYLREDESLISFVSGISEKMKHLTNTIEIISLKTVKQKIAFFMLSGNKDNVIKEKVSRIAVSLGCSREAVSRALTEMEERKMIVRGKGYIKIINYELLETFF